MAERHVRIIAISQDDLEESQACQESFPHLVFVADSLGEMARALGVNRFVAGPGSRGINAPTTILVDGAGMVRWIFRPERYDIRLETEEKLGAINQFLLGLPL